MLNRNQGSRLRCETTKAGVDALVRPASVGGYPREVALFVAIVVQFGLIVLVMRDWQLENVLLYRLMDLAFVGFIIHHLLPIRFQLPFFAMLSLVAIVFGLGETGAARFVALLTGRIPLADFLYPLIPGVTLIGIGLGLIGLCHLPVRFGVRVAAVAEHAVHVRVVGRPAARHLRSAVLSPPAPGLLRSVRQRFELRSGQGPAGGQQWRLRDS